MSVASAVHAKLAGSRSVAAEVDKYDVNTPAVFRDSPPVDLSATTRAWLVVEVSEAEDDPWPMVRATVIVSLWSAGGVAVRDRRAAAVRKALENEIVDDPTDEVDALRVWWQARSDVPETRTVDFTRWRTELRFEAHGLRTDIPVN